MSEIAELAEIGVNYHAEISKGIRLAKDDSKLGNTTLPSFNIEGGIYASFEVEGKYGDILKLIQWV